MKCELQPAPNEAAENRDWGARNRFTRQSKRVPHRNALSMKVTPAVVRLYQAVCANAPPGVFAPDSKAFGATLGLSRF